VKARTPEPHRVHAAPPVVPTKKPGAL
jgi:hypothetical protein